MARRQSTKVERVCVVCGVVFLVVPSVARKGGGKCCDWSCRNRYISLSKRRDVVPRFWRQVQKLEGCWTWTGSLDSLGYGQVSRDGRHVLAHRLSWELHNGPIPPGLCVLHRCDNPPCVNPEHLFLGTRRQNSADRDNKGRTARGERNGKVRLTEAAVRAIRSDYVGGTASRAELARRHNVTWNTIKQVVSGESWRHVKDR